MSSRLEVLIGTCTVVLTLALVMTMFVMLWLFGGVVADWRRESQEALKQHRSMLSDHTTMLVNAQRAFDASVRDHEDVMQRLGGR